MQRTTSTFPFIFYLGFENFKFSPKNLNEHMVDGTHKIQGLCATGGCLHGEGVCRLRQPRLRGWKRRREKWKREQEVWGADKLEWQRKWVRVRGKW